MDRDGVQVTIIFGLDHLIKDPVQRRPLSFRELVFKGIISITCGVVYDREKVDDTPVGFYRMTTMKRVARIEHQERPPGFRVRSFADNP